MNLNQGISGIVGLVGMVSSLLGMGTSTMSQVQAMRQMNHQPAQAQQCPPNTTPMQVKMADGTMGTVCYAAQPTR